MWATFSFGYQNPSLPCLFREVARTLLVGRCSCWPEKRARRNTHLKKKCWKQSCLLKQNPNQNFPKRAAQRSDFIPDFQKKSNKISLRDFPLLRAHPRPLSRPFSLPLIDWLTVRKSDREREKERILLDGVFSDLKTKQDIVIWMQKNKRDIDIYLLLHENTHKQTQLREDNCWKRKLKPTLFVYILYWMNCQVCLYNFALKNGSRHDCEFSECFNCVSPNWMSEFDNSEKAFAC